MSQPLVREDDELRKFFSFKATVHVGDPVDLLPVWRVDCLRCLKAWEVTPEANTMDGFALDKGTRNALMAHGRSHDVRPKMRRLP